MEGLWRVRGPLREISRVSVPDAPDAYRDPQVGAPATGSVMPPAFSRTVRREIRPAVATHNRQAA